MPNFSVYLPEKLLKKLDKLVEESEKSRNKMITEAVERYVESKEEEK